MENSSNLSFDQELKTPKQRSNGSFDSSDSSVGADLSTHSKDSHSEDKKFNTFTNEVVVIRPEAFYENEDCQKDNKFMKNSGL